MSAARVGTTLGQTSVFPDVRERFERALEITRRDRAGLLRVMVHAWLAQWEAAGSSQDYLGYTRGGRTWDLNVIAPNIRRRAHEAAPAVVVPFRPRLVPPPAGAAA